MLSLRFLQVRPARLVACAVLAGATALASPVLAFDLFGLFGERTPQPRADSLPYSVTIEAAGDRALRDRLRDASGLYRLRDDPPADADTLVRRAEADLNPLTDALWGEGYYDGTVEILVAGQPVRPPGPLPSSGAVTAAAALKGRAAIPITIRAVPGQRFVLRRIEVRQDRATGRTLSDIPPRIVRLKPGDPARAAELRAAQARMVDYLRAQSRPLARAETIAAVVDHPADAMDVAYILSPGPVAPIGTISVSPPPNVDERVIRSFIYARPGDPYSPQAISDIRKSVARIPALSSVRVREAESLDKQGQLPLFVEITERPPRVLGVSARYSTLDGPALRAYWEHRNLFGGAEQLRLEGETFLAERNDGTSIKRPGDLERSDIGARFRATFVKPALGGTRNDLLVGGLLERDRTGGDRFGGYTSRVGEVTAGIRHRFSDTFSVQGGLEYERGRTSDVLGDIDYRLIGVPLSLTYDSTDNPLDATRGIKLTASVTPFPSFLGSSVGFTEARASASTYFAFDEDARFVLAGRVGLGSVVGADLDEVPANHRFFAGGGGSVRGYRSRSLGPRGPFGIVTGGRSLLEGSLEARIKVTDTIGIVPFVDAGGAFSGEYPDFDERIRVSAGLGLRYYTAVGPIRLDVATPLNRRNGDRPVAVYISIGQAF